MCLAVPVKIIDIPSEGVAKVEIDGVKMNVSSMLKNDLKVGDFVLVHAGFILEKLDQSEALQRIDLINDLYQQEIPSH